MKKILSILPTISFYTLISTNIIACNIPNTNNKPNKLNKPIESEFIPQQPQTNSNWKFIDKTIVGREIQKKQDKWFFLINPYDNSIIKFNSKWDVLKLNGNIKFNNYNFPFKYVKVVYRWDSVGEPQIPTINKKPVKLQTEMKK